MPSKPRSPAERIRAAIQTSGLSISALAPRVTVVRQGITRPYLSKLASGAYPASEAIVEAIEQAARQAVRQAAQAAPQDG